MAFFGIGCAAQCVNPIYHLSGLRQFHNGSSIFQSSLSELIRKINRANPAAFWREPDHRLTRKHVAN
jgi:hypothetical protein